MLRFLLTSLLLLCALALPPRAGAQQFAPAALSLDERASARVQIEGAPDLRAGPENGFRDSGTIHLLYESSFQRTVRITIEADQEPLWRTRVEPLYSTWTRLPGTRSPGKPIRQSSLRDRPMPFVAGLREGGATLDVEYVLEPDELASPGTQTLVVTYAVEGF